MFIYIICCKFDQKGNEIGYLMSINLKNFLDKGNYFLSFLAHALFKHHSCTQTVLWHLTHIRWSTEVSSCTSSKKKNKTKQNKTIQFVSEKKQLIHFCRQY